MWPDASVSYSLLRNRGTGRYGILARQKQPECLAATMPFTEDLALLRKILRRLNREQPTIKEFQDLYLSGRLMWYI